jgi:hypothetical protein
MAPELIPVNSATGAVGRLIHLHGAPLEVAFAR